MAKVLELQLQSFSEYSGLISFRKALSAPALARLSLSPHAGRTLLSSTEVPRVSHTFRVSPTNVHFQRFRCFRGLEVKWAPQALPTLLLPLVVLGGYILLRPPQACTSYQGRGSKEA